MPIVTFIISRCTVLNYTIIVPGGFKMCTSFAVYGQEKTIYGMNFDTNDIDLKLKVNTYHDRNVFYFSALLDDRYRDIAGFNSEGFLSALRQ